MLPSLMRIFLGAEQPVDPESVKVDLTTREEAGDWLLISRPNSCDSAEETNSRVNSECDLDSVCSDSSWVITPAPTFKRSSSTASTSDPAHPTMGVRPAHSLEDLLIEHPTMSVYRQNSTNEIDSNQQEEQQDLTNTSPEEQVIDETNEERNQIRQRALLENQRRLQLAAQLQIPATISTKLKPPSSKHGNAKPPMLTRRALKRNNPMSRNGVKHHVQKCGFKAGRRRC